MLAPLHAAEISLRGTLQVINCSVNNGKPTDVSFGEAVGVNKVDGVRYRQPMPLEITCSQSPGNLLHLMFAGTPTDFDKAAIATGMNDLGIRLLQDDMPIEINQTLPIDDQLLPAFFAVPVKRPKSQLTGGTFSGLATLMISLE
ncbi:fimbrial protein [Pantoea sp. SOD02]|uniref:fimbrial protein n=1 Tax=Pantoea sp. SOD02 TaxID=2970818 RepID=UPI0021579082|nr:fimbrial protein [Pantoea sp. SOD02]UVC29326.1 fimbrial protein [Pantoea sp. SOD02]